MEYKDYYKIAGGAETPTRRRSRSAYRKLARKHHPDVNKGSAERFKEISEAHTVLSDPEKRKRYDTLGPDWERYAKAGRHPGAGARSPFEGQDIRFGGERRRLLGLLPHDLRRRSARAAGAAASARSGSRTRRLGGGGGWGGVITDRGGDVEAGDGDHPRGGLSAASAGRSRSSSTSPARRAAAPGTSIASPARPVAAPAGPRGAATSK